MPSKSCYKWSRFEPEMPQESAEKQITSSGIFVLSTGNSGARYLGLERAKGLDSSYNLLHGRIRRFRRHRRGYGL